MDNDDNDFQSRNFRLAGEDNSKFPLRPFTIPPFDLGIHLHGHLSFDNLVEQGDLLGITGQDESNWIESFSPGSSAISNAAADSCSISRRNNVWSEATSSESVEMLLKSVGEDNNMMDEKIVTDQPHSDDVLNNLSNNIDTCLTKIDSVEDSIMEAPIDPDSAIPPGNSNSTKNDFMGHQPSIDEKSLSVSSGNLIDDLLDDVDANANLVSSSAMCFEDHKLNEGQLISQKAQEEDTIAGTASNDHGISGICNTSLKSTHLNEQMDVDSSVAAKVTDVIMSEPSSTQKISDYLSHEGTKDLICMTSSMPSIIQREKSGVLQKCMKIDEGNVTGSSTSVLGNFSGSEKLVDSALLLEGFNEPDYYRNSDVLVDVRVDQGKIANKDVEMDNQMLKASNEKLLAVADNEDTGQPSNPSQETDSTMEATKAHNADFRGEQVELAHGFDGRELESSIVNMKDKQETLNCEHEGDLDENGVSVGNACSIGINDRPDEKQVSEMREPKDQFAQESKDIVIDKSADDALKDVGNAKSDLHEKLYSENVYPLGISQINIAEIQDSSTVVVKSPELHHADTLVTESCDANVISSGSVNPVSGMAESTLVGAQITSSATIVEGSLEKKIVEDKSDLTDGITISVGFISSSQSEDTLHPENTSAADGLSVDKGLVASSLPFSDLILSDIDSGKSSQLSSEICVPVLDDRDNSKTITLHASMSNSEPSATGTPGQPLSIMAMDSSPQISAQIAIILPNEVQQSTDNHATLGHVMDEKVHPVAASEERKNCESEKLPPEEYKKSPPSVSGDGGDPKENSLLCVNLSENNIQGKDKGHMDQTQSISDKFVCISKTDISSCQTESTSGDPKEKSIADHKNFTFEVSQISKQSEENAAKGWKPFSSPQSLEIPQEQEKTKSENDKHDSVPSITSQGSRLVSEEKSHDDATRSPGIDKSHSKSTASASKRKAKEKLTMKKISEKSEGPCNTAITFSRGIQVEEARHLPSADGLKVLSSPTVQTSNLPDLNSSTTTALFNQPFTDVQQVQLRAQIFVYGSLIQGIPPDESYMISAFGGSDGGRGKWLSIWRSFSEKFNRQKSPLAVETPNHSVVRALDQISRSSSLQSNVITTPLSQNGNKGSATPIFNSISPAMWSMSTRDILHSNTVRGSHLDHIPKIGPLYPYQSPPIRHYTGNANPWATQSPCPVVPWVAPSHNSAVSTAAHLSVPPITETVQFTPNRDVSVSHGSTIQFMSPSAFPTTGSVLNASVPSLMQIDPSKEFVPGRKNPASTDQKPRRRKKSTALEAIGQVSSVSEPQTELDPSVGGAPNPTVSPLHVNPSGRASSGNLVSTIAPVIPPTHFQIVGSNHTEPKIIFSEETSSKIEQAKLQAEDAAAFAAASVRHSEGIWNQLRIQKSSGLVSEVEQRLASAAVAASAAVSVAKAASAAAKLAADSALYAKLMADEAMAVGKTSKVSQCSESADQFEGNDLTRVTPASILKGKEKGNGSYSIIPAAREAARRRLEAASAANKRAEILDAVVKAAELAAEAVSQAGSVVAMGDPLPHSLSTILESGPEGIFKTRNSKPDQSIKTNVMHGEKLPVNKLSFNEEDLQETAADVIIRSSTGNHTGDVSGIASLTISVGGDGEDQSVGLDENIIKQGSHVEVKTDLKGPVGVWYSARVLDMTDSKAYVCYNELLNNEGSDKVKEWISLDSECNGAPRIRHPYLRKNSDGSKKRPRIASGTLIHDIGDLVDAWINEGWREGIVTEKSYETASQATKYIIHFPAGGDSSVVRSWDLRPSRVWKDGQWIEWCRPTKNNLEHHEGDTPLHKRRKISKSEAKVSCEPDVLGVNRKPHEFAPLPLSAKDKVFSFGKSRMEENNSERVKRIGLQKEGSRVVFGIPKPGKKRKFMDVSKQCVVDNTEKKREPSESVKFAKYLMPQSSTGWKNTKKVEPKIKRTLESKPNVPKPLKSRNVQSRNVADKESSSISISAASSGEGNSRGTFGSSRPHASHVDRKLEKKFFHEVSSFGNSIGTRENHVSVSTSSDVEAEKGKNRHYKEIPDALEPRRSIRRIQPTSRLLEGLQSSLVIPKSHSISHDKASKSSSHRTIPSSRGHGHR